MASYDANAGDFQPRYLRPGMRSIDADAVRAAAAARAKISKDFETRQISTGKWPRSWAKPDSAHLAAALNFEMRNAEIELSRAEEMRNPGRPMTAIEEEFLLSGKWTRD